MQKPEDFSHEVYERTMRFLENRALAADFDIHELEAEYEALTVYEGHGWTGRNAYKEAEIEGQIDAFQVFLHRYRQKKTG